LKIGFKNTDLLKEKIDKGKLGKLIQEILWNEKRTLGSIEIVFLSDPEILEINTKYLRHNYFTDVITFSYNKKHIINGDICISIDSVSRNALKFCTLYKLELLRVIIHGVLHLVGYNDQNTNDIKKMRTKEDFYLKGWQN
jgi:probable rRNA maturation factor